jgi:hypothetical protein
MEMRRSVNIKSAEEKRERRKALLINGLEKKGKGFCQGHSSRRRAVRSVKPLVSFIIGQSASMSRPKRFEP